VHGELWGILHRRAQPNQFLKFCKGRKKRKKRIKEQIKTSVYSIPRASSTATNSSSELSRNGSRLGFGSALLRGVNAAGGDNVAGQVVEDNRWVWLAAVQRS